MVIPQPMSQHDHRPWPHYVQSKRRFEFRGRLAIIRPFAGHASLQAASGEPPTTTGAKKNRGTKPTRV